MTIKGMTSISCKMLPPYIFLIAGIFFSLAVGTVADEQNAGPVRKSSSAELSLDTEFSPVPGTYYYDVFLKGMRIGKATIAVIKDGDEYIVRVAAKTRRMMQFFYRVKYRGEVTVSSDPLQPRKAYIEEQSGTKKKTIQAKFPRPDKVTTVELESKNDKPPTRKEKEFSSESFILDPFSIVLLIRSLKWELGTAEVFDVFTGNKQYELKLYCRGETTINIKGEQRLAWEIVPQTRTIEKPRKVKMSSFVIYLSKDSRKEILKISGHPKIGRIVARMRKFSPIKQ